MKEIPEGYEQVFKTLEDAIFGLERNQNSIIAYLKILWEKVTDLNAEVKLLDAFQDMMLEKWERTAKALFAIIIDVAKNGEITVLPRPEEKKGGLQIIVAFDGDKAGQEATDRFILQQINSTPKKRATLASLRKELIMLGETVDGLQTHYISTLKVINSLKDKKVDKQYKYK